MFQDRRDFPAWTVSLLALALLFPATAHAYRPFDFSDADVADSRTVEFEVGPVEYVQEGSERALHLPKLAVNFGLGRGYEFSFDAIHRLALNPEEGEARSSLVDGALALSKLLRKGSLQDGHGPSIAAEAQVLVPTRGESHLGAGASAVVSNASDVGVVHLQGEIQREPEGVTGGGAGLIVEKADTRGWRPVAEFKLEGEKGEPTDRGVLLGAIFQKSDGLAFDLGVNLGQAAGERWIEVRTGFTYELGPRGTAPIRHFIKYHLRRHSH